MEEYWQIRSLGSIELVILNMFGFVIHIMWPVTCRFSDIMHRYGDKVTLKNIRKIKPKVPNIFERERASYGSSPFSYIIPLKCSQ